MDKQVTYNTERLDHLGIVTGICQEIELVERVPAFRGSIRQNVEFKNRFAE